MSSLSKYVRLAVPSLPKDVLSIDFNRIIVCSYIIVFLSMLPQSIFKGKIDLRMSVIRKRDEAGIRMWIPSKNKKVEHFIRNLFFAVISKAAFNYEQLKVFSKGYGINRKFLQESCVLDVYKTKALEMGCVDLHQADLECLRFDVPIPDQFSRLILPEIGKFAEDSKGFDQPAEMQAPPIASQKTKPLAVDDQTSKEPVPSCCLCLERIRNKKFFDERRFGIMEKCDCVVCYGCVRKATGNSTGAVTGPVYCPSCYAKSDNVAASARWIKGKDKIRFFEEYKDTFQKTCKKLNVDWNNLPSRKEVPYINLPKLVSVY